MSGRKSIRVSGRVNGRARRPVSYHDEDEEEFDDYEDPLDIDISASVKNEAIFPEVLPVEQEIFGTVDSQDLVEAQERMQRDYHLETGSSDYHISQRLSSLERKMDFLLNVNTRILARVDKIFENMRSGVFSSAAPKPTNHTEFPLKTKEAVEIIDLKIANNMDKYVELFKTLLTPNGIVKNIGRIFDSKLLLDMNYGGFNLKTGLCTYINLNAALYESLKTEGFTFDEYKKEVRLAFGRAKNRIHKAKHIARKQEQERNLDYTDESESDKEIIKSQVASSRSSIEAVQAPKKMKTVENQITFPLKTVEEMEAIDRKIRDNLEKYTDVIRRLVIPDGLIKNIHRIFDKQLYMEINYAGNNSKKGGLNHYVNLNNAIYESARMDDDYSFDTYEKDIRRAFSVAKKRVYKENETYDNNYLNKISTICREKMSSAIRSNDFPIKTIEELEEMDLKIANNMNKYIDLFKIILMPDGLIKNIILVIDVNLVMQMNYGGANSKTGLSTYTNLNHAIYQSQFTTGYSFDQYKKDIRTAFQRTKNRVYKAKHEANKLKRSHQDMDDD